MRQHSKLVFVQLKVWIDVVISKSSDEIRKWCISSAKLLEVRTTETHFVDEGKRGSFSTRLLTVGSVYPFNGKSLLLHWQWILKVSYEMPNDLNTSRPEMRHLGDGRKAMKILYIPIMACSWVTNEEIAITSFCSAHHHNTFTHRTFFLKPFTRLKCHSRSIHLHDHRISASNLLNSLRWRDSPISSASSSVLGTFAHNVLS